MTMTMTTKKNLEQDSLMQASSGISGDRAHGETRIVAPYKGRRK